jgi:hypothetical protein
MSFNSSGNCRQLKFPGFRENGSLGRSGGGILGQQICPFLRGNSKPCRERASLDSERRIFWLAKAEEWEQCAHDEIAFPFRERNLGRADFQTRTHS